MNFKLIKLVLIFVTLIIVTTLVSCKKDYTCNCTVKETNASGNITTNDKLTINLKGVSKNTAKTNCVSYEAKNETNSATLTYDCVLKK